MQNLHNTVWNELFSEKKKKFADSTDDMEETGTLFSRRHRRTSSVPANNYLSRILHNYAYLEKAGRTSVQEKWRRVNQPGGRLRKVPPPTKYLNSANVEGRTLSDDVLDKQKLGTQNQLQNAIRPVASRSRRRNPLYPGNNLKRRRNNMSGTWADFNIHPTSSAITW